MTELEINVRLDTEAGARITGYVAPGFEPVLDQFAVNFNERGELGGGVAVYQAGQLRVELWGGLRLGDESATWERSTRTMVFSCSKGVLSVMAAMLVAEGGLDLDAPVSLYWPEFAANGKHDVSVRTLMSHQAGLAYLVPSLSRQEILSSRRPIEVLQDQTPLWEPGSWGLYHAHTFGWLLAEVLRRVSGVSHREFFRERLAGPLSLGSAFGVPTSELASVARVEPPMTSTDPEGQRGWEQLFTASPWWRRLLTLDDALPFPGFGGDDTYNSEDVLGAGLPGTGLMSSAHDLARIYGAAVSEIGGVRLADDAVLEDMSRYQTGSSRFPDAPSDPNRRWGSGFQIPGSEHAWPMLGVGSFGHDGAGGSIGFGHLQRRVGFGYVTNQMGGIPDHRANALSTAVAGILS